MLRRRGGEGGYRPFHVRRAAAQNRAVADVGGKGIGGPVCRVARRHDVGVAGEAEIGCRFADAGIEVVNARRAFAEGKAGDGKAGALERLLQDIERAVVVRGHALAANKGAGELDGVQTGHRLNLSWAAP